MKLVSLSKLIQEATIRANQKKGFEPIDRIELGRENYAFGIPFSITQKEDKKLLISFDVGIMDGLLPHFQSLKNKGEKFALTTAYENSIETKKVVKRDIEKIKTILQLKKRDLIKAGFLVKDTHSSVVNIQLNLDIDTNTKLTPTLTQEKIEQKRKQLGVKSFKSAEVKDLKNTLEKHNIKIPKGLETKKGALVSMMVELLAETPEDGSKISKESYKKIQKRINDNFKNLC